MRDYLIQLAQQPESVAHYWGYRPRTLVGKVNLVGQMVRRVTKGLIALLTLNSENLFCKCTEANRPKKDKGRTQRR